MRAAPPLRPPISRIIEVANRLRQIVGSVPDAAAFKTFVAQLLSAERPDLLERTPAGYRLRPDVYLELASGFSDESTRTTSP